MKKLKITLFFLTALILSYIIFNQLYKDTTVFGGLKLPKNPDEIKQDAAIFARELQLETGEAVPKTELHSNDALISYIQSKFGVKEGNKYLRDSVPAFYWEINWLPKGVSGIKVASGSEKKESELTKYLEELNLSFDSKGNLLNFTQAIADTLTLPKLSEDSARAIAEGFLQKYSFTNDLSLSDTSVSRKGRGINSLSYSLDTKGNYEFKNEKRTEQLNRTDYEFAWSGETNFEDVKKIITVSIAGNVINSFSLDYDIPDKYSERPDTEIFKTIAKIVFYIIIFILLAVIAFKRIKAYEIGFRLAFILGLTVAVCVGIEIYLNLNTEFGWELLIPLILGPLFFGIGVILIWAASETITREAWKEKFISIDLITKGYVFHSRVGSSVIKGISLGLLSACAALIILFLPENIFGLQYSLEEKDYLKHFSTASPALSFLFNSIYTSIFLIGVFFVFIVSGLKRRFQSKYILITLCALIWGISNLGSIQPIYWGLLYEVIIGGIFIYIFISTDILATLFTLITFYTVNSGYALFTVGNYSYSQSGYFLFAIMLLTVAAAVVSLLTKDKIIEYDSITPAFVKNITERQRMQRELEIARDVQMSFLPHSVPQFPGLDIASSCVPALEVGGDYYDFIELEKASEKRGGRFGIIIGDVSGKGTQAAFYMTLTKGFLKALCQANSSPADVLSKMNELFYDNVERGTFISIIYGIFDIEKNVFRLARAGHNPVILSATKRNPGRIEMLNPTGLAIGLEKGIVFRKTIKEFEVTFESGDIFVFYTDGFTEAMNRQKEEFGEERLTKIVENNSDKDAQEILDIIFKEVKTFIGKAHQHDDMTIVVVKVK